MGFALGVPLILVAALASTTNFCIPSFIYNTVVGRPNEPADSRKGLTVTGVDLVPLVDEGLGNSAYLVDLGDGRALVVDVSRDLRAVHEAAAERGLTVAFAADTHLHADFLSGAHQLAVDEWNQGTGVGSRSPRVRPHRACMTATRSTWAGCGCVPC